MTSSSDRKASGIERELIETVAVCIGRSSDGRTNRWRVTCPKCEYAFVPRTTMFNTQSFECEKVRCGVSLVADYAAEKVRARK